MLGREYELLPSLPYGGSPGRTSADSVWSCRAVSPAQGRPESALEPTIKLPVRESSGLLWTWPDTSPEGELGFQVILLPLEVREQSTGRIFITL